MACIRCMAEAGSQQLQTWVISCIAIIKLLCFPADDELGVCRTSLVSPDSDVVHVSTHAALACKDCN